MRSRFVSAVAVIMLGRLGSCHVPHEHLLEGTYIPIDGPDGAPWLADTGLIEIHAGPDGLTGVFTLTWTDDSGVDWSIVYDLEPKDPRIDAR